MKPGSPSAVAALVEAAGGRIVGRTRLQKTACLLELVGLGLGFQFAYHLHGPYSEDLSIAASDADALGLVAEEARQATWGGWYSTFTTKLETKSDISESARRLASIAADADSIELELAVTAAFLAKKGFDNPWGEVAKRKSNKATPERTERAKALYQSLLRVNVPSPLPTV